MRDGCALKVVAFASAATLALFVAAQRRRFAAEFRVHASSFIRVSGTTSSKKPPWSPGALPRPFCPALHSDAEASAAGDRRAASRGIEARDLLLL
jgi:hypothetical protein